MIMLICPCVRVGAAPVSLSGDFTHQVQRTVYDDGTSANNIETTTFLYANWPVDAKVTLFGRYGYEHFGSDEDHIAARYRLDQYGVRWFPDKETRLTIGKQGAYMGVYGGLLSIGSSVGQGMFNGLDFQQTTNTSTMHIMAGQFDKRIFGDAANDVGVYGVEIGTKLGRDQLTTGFLMLKNSGHYYSTSLIHDVGKAQFMTEYIFSAAGREKDGIICGVSYSLDKHDGVSITNHNLEAKAASAVSGYSNNTASTTISWAHSWKRGCLLTVSYERVHNHSDNSHYHTTTMAFNRSW